MAFISIWLATALAFAGTSHLTPCSNALIGNSEFEAHIDTLPVQSPTGAKFTNFNTRLTTKDGTLVAIFNGRVSGDGKTLFDTDRETNVEYRNQGAQKRLSRLLLQEFPHLEMIEAVPLSLNSALYFNEALKLANVEESKIPSTSYESTHNNSEKMNNERAKLLSEALAQLSEAARQEILEKAAIATPGYKLAIDVFGKAKVKRTTFKYILPSGEKTDPNDIHYQLEIDVQKNDVK